MRLNLVCDEVDKLADDIWALEGEIERLRVKGVTQASAYWMRKDDPSGKPDQLELTHSIDSDYYRENGTRREYIGVKTDKIEAALARIERGQRVEELSNELRRKQKELQQIERQIRMLELTARSKQMTF